MCELRPTDTMDVGKIRLRTGMDLRARHRDGVLSKNLKAEYDPIGRNKRPRLAC